MYWKGRGVWVVFGLIKGFEVDVVGFVCYFCGEEDLFDV